MTIKRKLTLTSLALVSVTWLYTLYWTMVAHGRLPTPWVL